MLRRSYDRPTDSRQDSAYFAAYRTFAASIATFVLMSFIFAVYLPSSHEN